MTNVVKLRSDDSVTFIGAIVAFEPHDTNDSLLIAHFIIN